VTQLRFRLWRLANRALRPLGYEVRRNRPVRASLEAALRNVRRLGVVPASVADVGAAYGTWSLACAAVFPESQFVLVEPLSEFEPFLVEAAIQLGNARYVAAAAGSSNGQATVYVHRDLVGSSTYREREPDLESESRRVEARTLDSILGEVGAQPPYLLKLDVQGAELDVLSGAVATLRQTSLLVLEVSFFEFFAGGPGFAAVVERMAAEGFALYDVIGLSYRPLDGALAQADVLFVPLDSPLRAQSLYASPDQRAEQDARFRSEHERRGQGGSAA